MVDQTRGHQNNAEHGRVIFFDILRPIPPLVQVAAVQKLLLDLAELEGSSDIGDRYRRAHEELLR